MLGFKFRNAHADQGAGDATDGCANGRTTECCHDRAGRNERANARNGQRADSSQQTQYATGYTPCAGADGGAFRGFGVVLVRKITAAGFVRKQHGHVAGWNAGFIQTLNDGFSLGFGIGETDNGF